MWAGSRYLDGLVCGLRRRPAVRRTDRTIYQAPDCPLGERRPWGDLHQLWHPGTSVGGVYGEVAERRRVAVDPRRTFLNSYLYALIYYLYIVLLRPFLPNRVSDSLLKLENSPIIPTAWPSRGLWCARLFSALSECALSEEPPHHPRHPSHVAGHLAH